MRELLKTELKTVLAVDRLVLHAEVSVSPLPVLVAATLLAKRVIVLVATECLLVLHHPGRGNDDTLLFHVP